APWTARRPSWTSGASGGPAAGCSPRGGPWPTAVAPSPRGWPDGGGVHGAVVAARRPVAPVRGAAEHHRAVAGPPVQPRGADVHGTHGRAQRARLRAGAGRRVDVDGGQREPRRPGLAGRADRCCPGAFMGGGGRVNTEQIRSAERALSAGTWLIVAG